MPLGNWEGGRCEEAESEYLLDVLCKELRVTANCATIEGEISFLCAADKERRFFMKNKKTLAAIIVLVILIAAAAVCWFAFSPKAVEGSKNITVQVTHQDGSANTFEIATDAEYLRGAMEQEGIIGGQESDYGLYVLTVDGETVDEGNQEWWCFTKFGERVDYGVDACVIEDGDHYEFVINVGW